MIKKIVFSIREKINKNIQFRDFLTINLDVDIDETLLATYITDKFSDFFPNFISLFTVDVLRQILTHQTHYIGFDGFLTNYNIPCIHISVTSDIPLDNI